MTQPPPRKVPALKVKQWLPGWNKIDFDPAEHRAKPPTNFFVFSLPARELRSLSGIARRQAKNASSRTEDLGIQRQHDPERSEEIGRFVEFGYPWSTLSKPRRASSEFNDLRKPGWLPTAVVLNILTKDDKRNGVAVEPSDLVSLSDRNDIAQLELPYSAWEPKWTPKAVPPFEIIDGQHRLWAFDAASDFADFELPVVAFVGLDISWQAYLFWTINIKPKRINSSLAFDLYPLLRAEDWLDRAEGHAVYRETRSQELTESLWSHPASPWYDRINMLGEKQVKWVSQSAWIKSLMATMVRSWDGRGGAFGGLFGGRLKDGEDVLGWSRAQQAAFLIFIWDNLLAAVKAATDDWAKGLRYTSGASVPAKGVDDLAFYGSLSLINTDQGVRGYLHLVNDMCYYRASQLKLNKWLPDDKSPASSTEAVSKALISLRSQEFAGFVIDIAKGLSSFDWRTSSAPNLDDSTRRAKLVFRGSSGYKELRLQLLEHLASKDGDVAAVAKHLRELS